MGLGVVGVVNPMDVDDLSGAWFCVFQWLVPGANAFTSSNEPTCDRDYLISHITSNNHTVMRPHVD